jgi:ribonuclease T1
VYSTGLAKAESGMGECPETSPRQAAIKWGLAGAVAFILAVGSGLAGTAAARSPQSELPIVAIGTLPAEARTTYQLIHTGGPFPHAKDGTVFVNRERQLPPKTRGHYREYTVKTQGSHDRGARRIVCGGEPRSAPQACYYTADHYASFSRIAEQ